MPSAGAAASLPEPRAEKPDSVGASARQQRRYARAERAGAAATANDRFLDAVIVVCVVVFVVLVMGFGMLVLQSALRS